MDSHLRFSLPVFFFKPVSLQLAREVGFHKAHTDSSITGRLEVAGGVAKQSSPRLHQTEEGREGRDGAEEAGVAV